MLGCHTVSTRWSLNRNGGIACLEWNYVTYTSCFMSDARSGMKKYVHPLF